MNLLEEYIIFCDGLVVLVPWTYFTRQDFWHVIANNCPGGSVPLTALLSLFIFTVKQFPTDQLWRLWCVYEWVCFLLCHDPMDIEICADPFVRQSTLPLFIDAIGNFKLANCQCFREVGLNKPWNKLRLVYSFSLFCAG